MQDSIVYINGLFTTLKNAKVSVLDRGFCYGDGLFETMRARNGKIFRSDLHIERLFLSLPLIFIDLPITRLELKDVLHETLDRNKHKNAIIKLIVTRGINTGSFEIDPDEAPTLVVLSRPHKSLSKTVYTKGVQISLISVRAPILPRVNKGIKSCNYLFNILIKELSHRQGSMEGIIVDPDLGVTEGATSNLFIIKEGMLKTPMANNSVLEGITRQVVMKIAKNFKVPVKLGTLKEEDVLLADEVFITNTGFDIVPVVRVNDKFIGNKKPGILTRFLQEELLKYIEEDHQT